MALSPTELRRLHHLSVDLLQLGLDLVGIVDPTPISDGASALISLYRRDFFGAAISAVSAFPYVGDLAKVGKLGRYQDAVREAIRLSKESSEVAEHLRPVLFRLKQAVDTLRDGAHIGFVRWLRKELDDAFPILARAGSIEKVIQGARTIEQARNEALRRMERYAGAIQPGFRAQLGRLGALQGVETGIEYTGKNGVWARIRLDFDDVKGPHYNVELKGPGVREKFAVVFPGTEDWIRRMRHRLRPTRAPDRYR